MKDEEEEEEIPQFRTHRSDSVNSRTEKRLGLNRKNISERNEIKNRLKIPFNSQKLSTNAEILLMLEKHVIIYSRNLKSLLFILITPIFFLYMLQMMQWLTDHMKNRTITLEHPIRKIDDINLNCFETLGLSNCISLGFVVVNGEYNLSKSDNLDINFLIKRINHKSKLKENEIEVLNKSFINQKDFYNIFNESSKKMYQYIISFCYGQFDAGNISIPCRPENFGNNLIDNNNNKFYLYTIVYNITNAPNALLSGYNYPYPIDDKLLRLKQIVDNSFLELFMIKNITNNYQKILNNFNLSFFNNNVGEIVNIIKNYSFTKFKNFVENLDFIYNFNDLKIDNLINLIYDLNNFTNIYYNFSNFTKDDLIKFNNNFSYLSKFIKFPQINNITAQAFPSTPSRLFNEANMISSFGSFYMYFPPMILFSIILLDIVKEKDNKLKNFVILNGMSLFSYWVSWIIVSIIFSLIVTGEILFLGYIIFKFDIFTNVNLLINFNLYFFFNLSLMFMAMMLSNYVNNLNSATTLSYSVIALGIVIQTVLTNYTIMYFLYANNIDGLFLYMLIFLLSFFMHLYPPFIFTKCFIDIIYISSSHFDYDLFQWIPGRYYSLNDMFYEYSGRLLIGIEYKIDSCFRTFIWFFISIIVYIILIIFKEIRDYYGKMYKNDNKIINKNNINFYNDDKNENNYFEYLYCKVINILYVYFPKFFIKYNPIIYLKSFYDTNFNYSKSNKRRNQIENSVSKDYEYFLKNQEIYDLSYENLIENKQDNDFKNLIVHDTDISVINEKKKIALLHRRRQPPNGIRILSLSKKFKNNSNEIIEAINDINIDIQKGESFGLLGPNGAGKTTLINLLSCQIKANKGYAKIGPFIIHSEMFIDSLYIQRMIGVCCQFDLFWEEMTVLEIISFFGRLKGINYIEKIQEKITLFGLNGKQKEYVSQLSGGMRRRLSLLISILGDPFILYLDEPTTGLDPVNRRKIWKIIDMLKKNKVLLLSTQNMEEADFLCDKVGVLMNGKLMFIGTCHEILQKNLNANFGIELQITVDNFDLDDNKKKRFEEFLKENFNKSKINVSQSGLYVIQIKNENKEEIKFCMEMVNKKSKNEKLNKWFNYIKDVVISQANLEKAFIDLCHIYQ